MPRNGRLRLMAHSLMARFSSRSQGCAPGFPHVHGPAHDQQKIIRGKRWYLFAPVQHHNVQFGPALAQEIAEQPGRLVIHMLEHKGSADHVSVLMSN